jgi:putative membrane protein
VSHTAEPHPNPDPRNALAAERTLLAWVRTGLAMMGFGFVVARFGIFLREAATFRGTEPMHSTGMSQWVGAALVVLGVVVNLLAAYRYVRLLEALDRGEAYRPTRWTLGVIVTLALALIGLVMTGYLVLEGS